MRAFSDGELLQKYAKDRDEAAFGEVVHRHIEWVYSSAVRQTRDSHLAEDITQSAFILLARKAKQFDRNVVLSAWLFRAVRYLAADALKAKWRRKHHEKEFGATMTQRDQTAEEWNDVAPALDAAVAQLRSRDRRAILLRFFERKTHAEIAHAMGISEGAAKMRVSRAIERLRALLGRRGVVLPATALAALLSAHAVSAAPASLGAATIAGATGGAGPAASIPWLKGIILAMTIGKQSAVAITAVVLLLLGGGLTYTILASSHAPAALPERSAKRRPEPQEVNLPADMVKLYALRDDEILKRIAPPFVKGRRSYMEKITMGDNLKVPNPDDTSLVFRWDPQENDPLQVQSFRLGGPDLQFALWGILGAREDVDAPEKMLRHSLPGDWVFRASAAPAQRAAVLQKLLHDQFNFDVNIERKTTPMEVILISGTLVPPRGAVQIYSDRMTDNKPGKGQKNTLANLPPLLRLILHKPVIKESNSAPNTPLATCLHTSAMIGAMPPKRLNAKIDMILANISRQTGLQLKREVRPVEAWIVREKGAPK